MWLFRIEAISIDITINIDIRQGGEKGSTTVVLPGISQNEDGSYTATCPDCDKFEKEYSNLADAKRGLAIHQGRHCAGPDMTDRFNGVVG